MPPPLIAVARHAMATRFEIVLHGENAVALRAAGEEALNEVERIEAQLSLYRPTSEIARVNARGAHEPVRVSPEVFRLIEQAHQLWSETGGAFDISIGPLVRCWGFMGGTGQMPTAEALAEARAKVGMNLIQLDSERLTVSFLREGAVLDLGAIGKGHAVACAAELLREAGIASALIHGGTSTIYAIGHPPQEEAWKVAIERPLESGEEAQRPLAIVPLTDEALSVSAIWGRSFQSAHKTYGHVIDPRTGQPCEKALLAVVILPSAAETDALSTALLTLGFEGHDSIAHLRPGMRTLLVNRSDQGQLRVEARGVPFLE